MNMKKTILGSTIILAGIILYGLTNIAASIYGSFLDGWYKDYGRFGTAMIEIGVVPIIISIICVIIGLVFIYHGLKNKNKYQ